MMTDDHKTYRCADASQEYTSQASDMEAYVQMNDDRPENQLHDSRFVYGTSAEQRKPQEEYTLEDYYALPDEQRVELIDGVFYDMAAPSNLHQALLLQIAIAFTRLLEENHGSCRVYPAPFDVQLDRDDRTMVQPDISVICDKDKLVRKGCYGAPDLVVEILSPSTADKDLLIKLSKYIHAGVREYWLVYPKEQKVVVYAPLPDTLLPHIYSFTDRIPVGIWKNQLTVDFGLILESCKDLYERGFAE